MDAEAVAVCSRHYFGEVCFSNLGGGSRGWGGEQWLEWWWLWRKWRLVVVAVLAAALAEAEVLAVEVGGAAVSDEQIVTDRCNLS